MLGIKLIEEYNYSFVGQLHFVSLQTDTIYPPNNGFFSMSPTFNIAATATYREMALEAGFTRFHQRPNIDVPMEFYNKDWSEWAKEDYNARGSDDDVVAFHWEDKYKEVNKLGLAISGFIQPSFGRIIENTVFHFGSCREALGVMDSMPELYQEYTKKINANYSDELIEEMIALAKANKPESYPILSRNVWDGITKTVSPPTDELNNKIELLKN